MRSQIQALAEGRLGFVRMFSLLSMLFAQVVLRRREPPCSGSRPGSCWLTTWGCKELNLTENVASANVPIYIFNEGEQIYCQKHFIRRQSNFL